MSFRSLNKYSHLKLIILYFMGILYHSKGIKATALKFSTHLHEVKCFYLNNVYLSIRISSCMHLVIVVAQTFHFIKTLKDHFLWLFMITLRWTGPNNDNRTLAPNTSKMVNKILFWINYLSNLQLLQYDMQNLVQKKEK